MGRVRASIEVAVPAAHVWRLVADFEHWPQWGPTVRTVESEATSVATGVTGRVQTPLRVWLPFEIGDVEPDRRWGWSVAGVEATGHTIEPLGDERCRVEFSAPRWAFLYVPVLRLGLSRLKTLAEDSSI